MDSNLNPLKNTLKYIGFGNSLTLALEAKVREGSEKFSIGATAQFDNAGSMRSEFPKDIVHYELLFVKSKDKFDEKYFINGFKATLEKGATKEIISNNFYLGIGNDVTAKEAYNLLSGRSILKMVEISKQYDLQLINSQGLVAEERKTSGIQEAKDFLSSKLNRDLGHHGFLQILDNGQLIRRLDSQGDDITPNPSGKLILVHNYYNKNNATLNKSHFSVENKEEAINAMQKIIADKDPDQQTNGFRIYESSGKFLLYNFEKDGQEIDISLNKKTENVWIKLDFSEITKDGDYGFEKIYSNHGFNLEKELKLLGIKELSSENEMKSLLASLGRGNIQSARLESGNRIYLEADPPEKSIKVYDENFNKIELNSENKNKGVKR